MSGRKSGTVPEKHFNHYRFSCTLESFSPSGFLYPQAQKGAIQSTKRIAQANHQNPDLSPPFLTNVAMKRSIQRPLNVILSTNLVELSPSSLRLSSTLRISALAIRWRVFRFPSILSRRDSQSIMMQIDQTLRHREDHTIPDG
jgi:hypothetical protein